MKFLNIFLIVLIYSVFGYSCNNNVADNQTSKKRTFEDILKDDFPFDASYYGEFDFLIYKEEDLGQKKVHALKEMIEDLEFALTIKFHWTWKLVKSHMIQLLLDYTNQKFLVRNPSY